MAEQSNSDAIYIVLSTTSALKIEAIKGAFATAQKQIAHELGVNASSLEFVFLTASTKSQVNEQPMGWEETIRGANNRTKHAIELVAGHNKPRFVVAIENGIVEILANADNKFMDVGWVILTDMLTERQFVSSTTSVSIPSESVEMAKHKGLGTFTVGDVLHERNPSISPKDPHLSLLGGLMSRVPLMEQAVLSCIGQWMYSIQQQRQQ